MFFKIEKLDFEFGRIYAMRCDNEADAQIFLNYLESQQHEPWSDSIKTGREQLPYFDFSNDTCYIVFSNSSLVCWENSEIVGSIATTIFDFKDYDWLVDDMLSGQHAIKILESEKIYPDFNMTLDEILLGGKNNE